MHDVIIIGKGPAGLSASLYTKRANLETIILGKNNSSLRKAGKIENYFGFSNTVTGEYLLQEGEKQAEKLGVVIMDDEVVSIEKKDYFEVATSRMTYTAKAVLIATGQPQKKIKIKNLDSFEGKGVAYCTTCDGFFYNNLKVGVLGFKDYAVHEAIELLAFTHDITIYTNGNKLELTEKFKDRVQEFKINTKTVVRLDGIDFLQKVYFDDGNDEDIDGMFIAYDSASSLDFSKKLGVITEGSSIIVNADMRTNLEGLFAAGDCTGGFKQVSTAVGQGALAGRKMIEYIRSLSNNIP